MENPLRSIVEELLALPSPSQGDVKRSKMEVCRAGKLPKVPGNAELIAVLKLGRGKYFCPYAHVSQ